MASGGTTGATSGRTWPLERMVEYAHRRHWVEQYHEEAKGLLGWDQYQGRLWTGFHRHAVRVMLAYSFLVWQEWQQTAGASPPGPTAAGFFPLGRIGVGCRCRRCIGRSAIGFALEAAKEWLSRELMTVPERIPA